MVIHHIVTDGWSMSIIFNEVAEVYESHTTGNKPDLSPLAVTYSDFARWQQDHFTEKALAPTWLIGKPTSKAVRSFSKCQPTIGGPRCKVIAGRCVASSSTPI